MADATARATAPPIAPRSVDHRHLVLQHHRWFLSVPGTSGIDDVDTATP
jgi:hypothetical protein